MVIQQGDLFWIDLGEPKGSGPGYLHPYVIIQNNLFNKSKLNTVIVCALTSNLQRGEYPGNVTLEKGEGGLSRARVVNVTQVFTVDKSELGKRIGKLSPHRSRQILEGLKFVLEERDADEN